MKIENLKFEDVSFQYEGQDPLLKNCTFDFPSQSVVWIKGSEGIGKSSLLQILAALQTPQSGAYYINELNTTEMSFEEFLPYRLRIGYSFDYGGLISNRSIFENLILPLNYHKIVSPQEAQDQIKALLKYFDIEKFANERPAHVPGRVRKLACVLRSTVMFPDMLLLDDPTDGLGQETLLKFVDYVHDLRKEGFLNQIFVSTYDEQFMSHFEYKIVHIEEGQLYLQEQIIDKKAVAL